MKKVLICLAVCLVLVVCTFAYEKPLEIRHAQIKFYYGADANEAMNLLNQIPAKYFDGLTAIEFFDKQPNYISYKELPNGYELSRGTIYGRYYPRVIYIFHLDMDTITHELAHHLQYIHGEDWQIMHDHGGNFTKYKKEIEDSL